MNAFVLAGDGGASRQICGMNKAFLPLEGRPLLIWVLAALDRVRSVDRIYIVGPQKQIMAAIEKALPEVLFEKKIEVLEQKERLVENILSAYAYSLPGYRQGYDSRQLADADRPALFLPADIPLVTGAEIEAFIAGSDMERYDYCLGVTPEEALTPFYPKEGKPGIEMAYVYLNGKAYRMNNLHLARPYRVGAGGYVQKMYDHRYQRHIGNRFRIAWEVLQTPRWPQSLLFYLLAQGAVTLMQAGFPKGAAFFRRPLAVGAVERAVSHFLKTRFKSVETSGGGAALDIDDEAAYRTISRRFREWQSLLARSGEKKMEEGSCPFRTDACG